MLWRAPAAPVHGHMPAMTIRVVNATFQSTSTGEFDTLDDAYRAAVMSGLEIAADEVRAGLNNAVVEVSVDLVGQRGVARGALSISTGRFLDAASA